MSRVVCRRAARQDLVDVVTSLLAHAGPATARRFRERAEAQFPRLASRPGLGAPYDSGHPALAGLRASSIPGFKPYLVFYRPVAEGIEVVRILHGARDIAAILAREFDIEDGD